jgi:16S rRNA (guanine527-N7)-methyltransferase
MSAPGRYGALHEILVRAQELGFLGPAPIHEQIAHAQGFADTTRISEPVRWLDLGSGGGLPGLVLAQRWPRATGVLLDAARRRTDFLSDVIRELGWHDRMRVVTGRAEDAGRDPLLRGAFDLVVARAFGPPAVTAECAAPFLSVGGRLVVSEPPAPHRAGDDRDASALVSADADTARWPADALRALGMTPGRSVRGTFGYQVLVQDAPCPDRFPRRAGVPTKRPLYR